MGGGLEWPVQLFNIVYSGPHARNSLRRYAKSGAQWLDHFLLFSKSKRWAHVSWDWKNFFSWLDCLLLLLLLLLFFSFWWIIWWLLMEPRTHHRHHRPLLLLLLLLLLAKGIRRGKNMFHHLGGGRQFPSCSKKQKRRLLIGHSLSLSLSLFVVFCYIEWINKRIQGEKERSDAAVWCLSNDALRSNGEPNGPAPTDDDDNDDVDRNNNSTRRRRRRRLRLHIVGLMCPTLTRPSNFVCAVCALIVWRRNHPNGYTHTVKCQSRS